MKWLSILVMVYGLIIWFGGMIGYAKANSLVSLIMGSISASLLVVAGLLMLRPAPLGFWFALAVTGSLTLLFGYRYLISYKFMPAGMMALLSLAVLCVLIAFAKFWIKSTR